MEIRKENGFTYAKYEEVAEYIAALVGPEIWHRARVGRMTDSDNERLSFVIRELIVQMKLTEKDMAVLRETGMEDWIPEN